MLRSLASSSRPTPPRAARPFSTSVRATRPVPSRASSSLTTQRSLATSPAMRGNPSPSPAASPPTRAAPRLSSRTPPSSGAHKSRICRRYAIVSLLVIGERLNINNEIRARELRVIGAEGENLGVLPIEEALRKAKEAGQDLIEISPQAVPPVAKIADYGKFEYERSKKDKAVRAKSKVSETKEVQIKVGTGEHDMLLKARKADRK